MPPQPDRSARAFRRSHSRSSARQCLHFVLVIGCGLWLDLGSRINVARAATASTSWPLSIDYIPSFTKLQGVAPLTTRARWSSSLAVLFVADRWPAYPWYQRIFVDWGDGTSNELPAVLDSAPTGAPNGVRRRAWSPLSLTHVYRSAGTYTVRMRFTKPGAVASRVLRKIKVTATATAARALAAGQSATAAAQPAAGESASDAGLASATVRAAASSGRDGCAAPRPEPGAACDQTRLYDIRYMAFAPFNHLRLEPNVAACRAHKSAPAQPLVLAGDDRGFAEDPIGEQRFRVAQRIVLRETRGAGGSQFDVVSRATDVRPDVAFQAGLETGSALRHGIVGRLDASDHDAVLNDCHLRHRLAAGGSPPLPRILRSTGTSVTLSLRGSLPHGLLPARLPRIEWDLFLRLEPGPTGPRLHLHGRHDAFAAHELYVNDQVALRVSPVDSHALPLQAVDLPDELPRAAARLVSLVVDPPGAAGTTSRR